MANSYCLTVLTWLLAAVFVHAAYLNLAGPAFIREEHQAWGFAPWFRYLVGILELLGVALCLSDATRVLGMAIFAVLMLGVCVTLIKAGDWHRLAFPIVLLVIIGLVIALRPVVFHASLLT